MIVGFRRSSGERLPAVPGGLVPPERKVQRKQRNSEKIKEKGAARGVATAAGPRAIPFACQNCAASFLSRNFASGGASPPGSASGGGARASYRLFNTIV
jgi:hypothetical protein